ncbi:MAG: hypothetical protein LQ348_006843 [Seirophora lacunosa]|nr:MAG: hypothetical protein LQ348_006843 [Seirophora lacunosa]
MSEPISLAAAHLKKAKEHLDLIKSQCRSAEANYESAKHLYEAVESSQTSQTQSLYQLCESCAVIPILKIFKPTSKPYRHPVGNLFRAIENQSSCTLCKFFIEAFQVGSEDPSGERLHAQLTPRDTAIYFAQDPIGKPWYYRAGIDCSRPSCPFVWLQTGPPTLTGQPFICISLQPTPGRNEIAQESEANLHPRQRGALEAFNGSLNYDLVKSWLGRCCAEHGAPCLIENAGSNPFLQIYLIDVHKRRFVRYTHGDRYAALSYVWGKGHAARSGRVKPLPGAQLPTFVPQTMLDAITFVEGLGERYLWIDQLCIDQTNDEEMQRQMDLMDQIFAIAHLTIVCVDGPDADWGLPGVSRPLQRIKQPTIKLDCGQLTATFIHSQWDNNGTSVWDSRAWTLQERALSRRCVMFTHSYISMICRQAAFHDCLPMTQGPDAIQSRLDHEYFREDGSGIILDQPGWDFKDYDAVVSVFSSRQLSHQTDALNACRGLFNRLSAGGHEDFYFGIPTHDYHRASIWVPHFQHVLSRRIQFPSWSWAGWTGRIEYPYWVNDMAEYVKEDGDDKSRINLRASKRRRVESFEAPPGHMQRAQLTNVPYAEGGSAILRIETTVAKFQLKLLRHDSAPHRTHRTNSFQSKTAIGDHWTLLGQDGRTLRNEAGEHQCFELTDHFFRLKPEYSQVLVERGNEAEFMFVQHWPRIRDSEASNKWLYNMVSALLIISNKDGNFWRLAAVLLKAEDWYAKSPKLSNICLV